MHNRRIINNDHFTSIMFTGAFRDFAAKFDFSRYTTLGDFGGSTGVLCCCVAEKHQHMTCTTYDLPAVHNAAVKYALKQQLQNRVQVHRRQSHLAGLTCVIIHAMLM